MMLQAASGSREGIVGYLFYAAGALAGLSAGLLEVLAQLLLAGLHLAITNAKASNHHQAPSGAEQLPCCTLAHHAQLEQDSHGPRTSVAAPVQPVPEAPSASVDASSPYAEVEAPPPPDGSDSRRGESSALQLGVEPGSQDDNVSPGPGLTQVAFPGGAGATAAGVSARTLTDAEDGAAELLHEPAVPGAPFVVSLESPVAASDGGKQLLSTSGSLANGVHPLGASDAAALPAEPVLATAEIPQQRPQATSASPCCDVPSAGAGAEVKSESCGSGVTAASYSTKNAVDRGTGTWHSKASAASASAAPSTPGLSYTQRLEEKRPSSRRKGAHKAKAR